MREGIKAPLVLTVISAAVCGMLAFANALTADKIEQAEQAALQESLTQAFGEAEYETLPQQYEGIRQVIQDADGRLIFDVISSGYETDGQHLLIGIDPEGAVCGVCVVSIADSPTQAAKVQEDTFLSQFLGRQEATDAYDAVAGATKSSQGIQNAVNLVLETYRIHKEAMTDG